MIFPISINKFLSNTQRNSTKQNNPSANHISSLKLSGFYNPMKSYITFGYCEKNGGHYQHMYEIDEKFSQKVTEKIEEIEKIKNAKSIRFSLEDESNIQAAKILMQYSNMQTTFAEMPPAYTIVTGTKLKEAMNRTQVYTNPVSNLITINNIFKIKGANPDLPESRQGKATRAAQLYSTIILLDQIKQNKVKSQFNKTENEIDELVSIIEKNIKEIYGDDIFERVDKLSKMGRKVSLENQRMALDFLIETDCVSKELKLPSEYEKKLSNLIARQNIIEGRNLTHSRAEKKLSRTIKVFYPDHEHTMEHLNGTPHTHEHHHDHSSEYQMILERMHSEKSQEHKHTNEKNKNLNINYINEGE